MSYFMMHMMHLTLKLHKSIWSVLCQDFIIFLRILSYPTGHVRFFKVVSLVFLVKKCKSSLERQVREAVRIQMRGNVLNKKGLYNRCKLTRLVVDEEWDQKVWQESWQPRGLATVDEE
jgi:hypothetical protein